MSTKWLKTGENVSKEEVERAIKEQKEEMHMQKDRANSMNGSPYEEISTTADDQKITSLEPESEEQQ